MSRLVEDSQDSQTLRLEHINIALGCSRFSELHINIAQGWSTLTLLQWGEMGENDLGDCWVFLNCVLYFLFVFGFILFKNG